VVSRLVPALCSLSFDGFNVLSSFISAIMMFPDDAELVSKIFRNRSPDESTDDPEFRRHVAAEVLSTYAEGRLGYSQAIKVVEPIADLSVYRNMIDSAVSTGKFQTLGESRNIYPPSFAFSVIARALIPFGN
jgi:hypothetical protein